MTDYRLVMSLLLQDRSYRDIEAIAGCSHRTIAKAKKVCHEHGVTATSRQLATGRYSPTDDEASTTGL